MADPSLSLNMTKTATFSQNTAQPKTFLITLAIHSTDTNLAPNNKTRHKQQQQEIRKDIKFINWRVLNGPFMQQYFTILTK